MVECSIVNCHKEATHQLHYTVVAHDVFNDYDLVIDYCLDDALMQYGWFDYVYPGEYKNMFITPPSSTLFINP